MITGPSCYQCWDWAQGKTTSSSPKRNAQEYSVTSPAPQLQQPAAPLPDKPFRGNTTHGGQFIFPLKK